MSKSVLCAFDISDPGADRYVLEVAARQAKLDNAQLDVVTVVPDFGMSMVGSFFEDDHQDKMLEEAKKQLNQQVLEILGEEENAKVRHIVASGKTYDQVLKTANSANSSLIVVGAHQPDLADYLLGPNAARVVRHASCSVYVVR